MTSAVRKEMKKLKINSFVWALMFSLGLSSFGCAKKEMVHIVGKTMGTQYNIKYFPGSSTPDRINITKGITNLLIKVNDEMSTYQKTSEITFFNKKQRPGNWLEISKDFYTVTKHALEIAKLTNGAFDPTIGPLVNLWGFGPDGKRKIPSQIEITKAKKRVGYKKVELSQDGKIRKKIPQVYLDLSASAKGFGVDKVTEYLEGQGVKDLMVEIGGELLTRGKKEKSSWKIAIEAPHPTKIGESFQKIIDISGLAVATSGSYRNYFSEDGADYSHAINYRTGQPIRHTLASVSVIDSKSCMFADSMATALMVMGPVKGMEFAEKQGLAAFFIYKLDGQKQKGFVEKGTSHFLKLVNK